MHFQHILLQITAFSMAHFPHTYFLNFTQISLVLLVLQYLILQDFRTEEAVVVFIIVFDERSLLSCLSF